MTLFQVVNHGMVTQYHILIAHRILQDLLHLIRPVFEVFNLCQSSWSSWEIRGLESVDVAGFKLGTLQHSIWL